MFSQIKVYTYHILRERNSHADFLANLGAFFPYFTLFFNNDLPKHVKCLIILDKIGIHYISFFILCGFSYFPFFFFSFSLFVGLDQRCFNILSLWFFYHLCLVDYIHICTALFFYAYNYGFRYVEIVLRSTEAANLIFGIYLVLASNGFLLALDWNVCSLDVIGTRLQSFQGMRAYAWHHGFPWSLCCSWFLFSSCRTFGLFLWVCIMLSEAATLALFLDTIKPFYVVFIFTFLIGFVWFVLVYWLHFLGP